MAPLDRRRRALVNRAEELTDAALRESAPDLGLRVDAKTRLANAVEIDRAGLSDETYRNATAASQSSAPHNWMGKSVVRSSPATPAPLGLGRDLAEPLGLDKGQRHTYETCDNRNTGRSVR